MRRLVIIDQDGNTEENNIIEKLFSIREEEIERPSPVRNQYIKENNLKDVTHDMIIDEIEQNINLDEEAKQKILDMLDKLLENRARIQSFDCKVYYKAGVNDIIDIIFSKSQIFNNKDWD